MANLQISKLDPEIIRKLKIYEAEHDMEHWEVFTKAFLLLLESGQ
jgi:plasmid stability protein